MMREWKACEVIVKQREKEMQSAIFAKLSSGSSIDSHVLRLIHRDSTISNEVSHRGQLSFADSFGGAILVSLSARRQTSSLYSRQKCVCSVYKYD